MSVAQSRNFSDASDAFALMSGSRCDPMFASDRIPTTTFDTAGLSAVTAFDTFPKNGTSDELVVALFRSTARRSARWPSASDTFPTPSSTCGNTLSASSFIADGSIASKKCCAATFFNELPKSSTRCFNAVNWVCDTPTT